MIWTGITSYNASIQIARSHERYIRYIDEEEGYGFDKITFGNEEVDAAKIGASANRYDIISELGEDYIRSTVLAAYEKWKVEENNGKEDSSFTIDEYMEQLKNNYNKIFISTDFYFSDNEDEIVFAKDLKTYDDLTLQYVGIILLTLLSALWLTITGRRHH